MPAEEVTLARVFRGIKVLEVMKINHLGPVHMGRSYLGYRENISISPCCEILWKVADEKFSRVSLTDRRDLGDRDNFYPIWTQLLRSAGKFSVYTLQNLHHIRKLYPVSGTTFLRMNRTKLFDLSKCFLGNRDKFCPYERPFIGFLSRQLLTG